MISYFYSLVAVLAALAIPSFGFNSSYILPEPPKYLKSVYIQIGQYQNNRQWYAACALSHAQVQSSSFQFALKTIRVESCDHPDRCYPQREMNTDRTTKVCSAREKKSCVFKKLGEQAASKSNLQIHGKVTCSVEIDAQVYETYDYYFRGISYNYYLISGFPSLREMLAIGVKASKVSVEQREVTCTALSFLFKANSLTLTLIYTSGSSSTLHDVQPWYNPQIRSWTCSYDTSLTWDIRSITCSVRSINSDELIGTTYDVMEEDRPHRSFNPESETTKTETTTSTQTKTNGPMTPHLELRPTSPTTGSSNPNQPTTTPKSANTKEEHGQRQKATTRTTTVFTSFPSMATNAISPVKTTNEPALTIVFAFMGLGFLGLLLLTSFCVHRYFTITWICCWQKSPSQLASHELKPMKSVVVKFGIPSKYMISLKELSVDYSQIVSQGQFSTLYQGHLNKSGKRSVVVKVNKIGGDAIEIASLINDVQMRIFAGETNEGITPILGAYFNRTAGKVYIAMQSGTQRNMREFLTNQNMPMGQMKILNMPPHEMIDTFCTWLKGVSQGLEFLHGKRIVHGNLAAENILVCLQNTSSVSITGFSHSQQLTGNSHYFVKSRSWTTGWETSGWKWMPMQALRYMEFSKESDIWSFGVLMWEIFSLGAIPYSKFRYSNMSMEFIQNLEFGVRLLQPQLAPREIYRKMEACWNRYGKDRPKASQLRGYFNEDQTNLINYVNLAE